MEAATAKDFNVAPEPLVVPCAWGSDTAALKEVVERSKLDLIAFAALLNIELKEIVQELVGWSVRRSRMRRWGRPSTAVTTACHLCP